MTPSPPATSLQLRSHIKGSGELEISLVSVPTPSPGPDQVLVRIEATPINPSDLGLLFGAADMAAARAFKGVVLVSLHRFDEARTLATAILAETPDDPRTLFYLAQTQRDRGEPEAARQLYRRRAELGGWDEEVFYSRYQQALMEDALGLPEATETLQQAWDIRPVRAEPLYQLARINRLRRRHHLAWIFATLAAATPRPEDVLFVENWVYHWAARFERADAAWRIGEHELSAELCVELLNEGHLPDDHREHLEFVLGEVRRS